MGGASYSQCIAGWGWGGGGVGWGGGGQAATASVQVYSYMVITNGSLAVHCLFNH